ncbi:MFS transporter [Streptomyces alkaliterrae]|uniref:MFS transporter n=1 Tax=Streptomyces alkaliterrae TaxID=2213162 RepID=A0A5P0YNA0_9ACTN|nr:MFS transporter [Streptomyces alkaliterrae]MBB1257963.1 MFS transporter [Streptomyces alkaliterrae]MQS01157.1 MFS transporter [Streptomyces alkaliterrae]
MPSVDTGAPVTSGASAPPFPESPATSPSPRRVNLALFAIGLATFALLFSTQALLPALSADFAVTPDQASWTVSATTMALALSVLPLSMLSERFGRRRMMTVSVSVAVGVALLLPLAPDLRTLIALRIVQGVAIAGIPASAMAYLSEELPRKALIGAIGLFVAGNSVGGMTGRILTGWVAEGWGWRAALLAVALLALVCAVAYRLLAPAPRNFSPAPLRPAHLVRVVRGHLGTPLLRRLYLLGMLFMSVFGAIYTVIGYRLVAEPFGLSQGLVGSIFVVYLVGTASSAGAGRMVGRFGRRGTLYVAITTTAVGLLLTTAGSLAAVLTGLVLITAGFFAGHATASSAVSRTATEGRAQASALYQMAYYLGASLGGTLGALAYAAAGWPATVALCGAALVAAAGITLYATRVAARAANPVPATA